MLLNALFDLCITRVPESVSHDIYDFCMWRAAAHVVKECEITQRTFTYISLKSRFQKLIHQDCQNNA